MLKTAFTRTGIITRSTFLYNRMASTSITAGFKLNHTMLRVKDIKKSLQFYTEVLGMELVRESPGSDFCNYFLAFDTTDGKLSAEEKKKQLLSREGVLELCHNFGTESDPNFKGYVSGNEEPHRGFGHIAVSVPDMEAAVAHFDKMDVKFKKRPEEGRMKHIAFIYDPDDWVEIVPNSF